MSGNAILHIEAPFLAEAFENPASSTTPMNIPNWR
jgi:hypothetical protein